MAPLTLANRRLVLNEETAVRTWNWLLTRQGLTDSQRLTSAWDAADAALGLHAARLPSPYAMVAARTDDSAIPGSLFTAPVRASLLTLRCMRKTLHTLPLHLASAAHAATVRFRERRAFNQIGEALPTIIVNGMVAGTWTWDNRTCSIRTSVISGRTTPAIRRQIRTRAAELTRTLRTAWTPAR